ncbi:Uncharacterised protein [Vibrio cholerae]|nr:Uncharacterised protein [Vibrio cholerae]CSA23608.1 Uncharacterised protein [Vibrio cholerae]CSA38476.1 Uncharacterised protein [Vibrio cholerae]CSA43951.1 Uncharacterised protein [Vibrio cholerae]CSA56507.1 Uncharacterised protein [Vibrio cholerae]
MPDDCGSTKPSISCVVTMASIALPPWRKIEAPASLASGLAAVTIQFLALTNDLCSKPVACSGATASVA